MDGPSPVQMRMDGDIAGLFRAMRSFDSDIAQEALELLGDIGGPTAIEALLDYLERPNERQPWLRLEAAKSLGQLRERRAVPALPQILDAEQPDGGGLATETVYGPWPPSAGRRPSERWSTG